MIDAIIQGLGYFLDPVTWLFLFAGIFVGLWFGVVPAIGALLALALLLPFIYFMPPQHGLPFLLAILAVSPTGGTITTILLNVPGDVINAATLLDGFPMAKKGEAGRALGAALAAAGLGGMISAVLALGMVLLIVPFIMATSTGDMVFIILVGLCFIGTLGTGSAIKGMISGGLGLLISFVGFQAITGLSRFTFSSMYLYDGVPLVVVGLGLFAFPEMIDLAISGGSIAQTSAVVKGMHGVWQGVKDPFRHWWILLRSAVIGYIVGVIPGIGAGVAPFVAYGQAKQTSKHPEKFGTGVVEGVIAPESATNAVAGGALLTTLTLGIPGSATTALILGGMLMLGIIPGPEMITKHLPLSLFLLWTIIIANFIGAGICILLANQLAKIAFIPGAMLVPLVTAIVFVGIYASDKNFYDVISLLVFSGVGLAMKRFGYSRPALMLGYLLGFLFEKYFFMAYAMKGPFFFISPLSLIMLVAIVTLFAYKPVKNLLKRGRKVTSV